MKSQLNKIVSGAATIGVFLVGCIMAGLGLSLVFSLAVFGLVFMGLGIMVAPLLPLIQPSDSTEEERVAA